MKIFELISMQLLKYVIFLELCLFVLSGRAKNILSEDDVTDSLIKYVKKNQTNKDAKEFNRLVELMKFPNYFFEDSFVNVDKQRISATCIACRSFVNAAIRMYETGSTEEEIVEYAIEFCTLLQVQPHNVCRGFITLNADIAFYILNNQPLAGARGLCGVVLQNSDPNSCPIGDERYDWTIGIPPKRVEAIHRESTNDPPLKIVHITDSHYDRAYEPDSLAVCNEPACCRKGQTEKESHHWKANHVDKKIDTYVDDRGIMYVDIDQFGGSKKVKSHTAKVKDVPEDSRAGHWGDYRNCDSPWWAFEDAIDFIAENHKDIDYVYYTGDVIDHGVWETTFEMKANGLNKTFSKMKEAFGSIPVFSTIGNHESQPTNQYAPSDVNDPRVSSSWLYDLLFDLWSGWVPEDAKAPINEGGYYTVLVRPGFRIISLNTNVCHVYNWWIHYEPRDPSGQLTWLVETLFAAENAGEKVHILTHIPPGGGSSYIVCSREYNKITERFADTIVAEFNGHSHKDGFKISYKKENGEPYNVAILGGSLTSNAHVNPNYRIYQVDAETYDVLDIDTWIYNLTEANLTPEQRPRWFKEYSFREHYSVNSLHPVELDALIQRMVTTEKHLLAVDYHRFRGKSAPGFVNGICGDHCIRGYLCDMVEIELRQFDKCNALWEIYNSSN